MALLYQVAPAKPESNSGKPENPLRSAIPRHGGAVLRFSCSAQKGNTEIAAFHLNTPLRGADAEALAQQVAVVWLKDF